jgi:hypothetical protein
MTRANTSIMIIGNEKALSFECAALSIKSPPELPAFNIYSALKGVAHISILAGIACRDIDCAFSWNHDVGGQGCGWKLALGVYMAAD